MGNSSRFLVSSAVLIVMVGAVVAPYFVLDILALTAIAFVVAQQFLKHAEWPDWLPGRPLVARSRIMTYATLTRPRPNAINAGIGANPFERSVIERSDPFSMTDKELMELKLTRAE